jgi:putative aldouronate transport system substrate-binding protein
VNDLVKNYQNIARNITPEQLEVPMVPSTGLSYAVPRTNKINRWGVLYNERWFKKLGFTAPTTLEELYEYGKAVAAGDPDGNGQNDTYLLSPDGTPWDANPLVDVFLLSGQFHSAPDMDGAYKIREKKAGYYPFLDYMRRLYAERILDPEYIVNKTYGGRDKTMQERVAMVNGHDSNVPQDLIQNNNGAFDFINFYPPVKGQDGKRRNFVAPPVWGGWGLPESSKKTQDALRFLDWGNSPEGFEALNCGVPGLTYTSYDLQSRSITQTPEQAKLAPTVTSSYMSVSFAYEGIFPYCSSDPRMNDYYNKTLADYLSKVEDIPAPSVKLPEWDAFQANNPDLITKKTELENKYIMGEIGQNDLRNFIDNEWLPKAAPAEAAYLKLMAARN